MSSTSCLIWLFKYKSSSSVNTFSSLKHNYGLKVDTKNSTKELHIYIFLISVSIYSIATVLWSSRLKGVLPRVNPEDKFDRVTVFSLNP